MNQFDIDIENVACIKPNAEQMLIKIQGIGGGMKIKKKPDERYSTIHEKEFIRKLGTFNEGILKYTTRKELLQNYIKSLKNRSKWDDIDKDKILVYAQNSLEKAMLAEGDNGGFGMYV